MKLIQFSNDKKETLRGVLSPADSNRAVVCVHGFERMSEEKKFANLENKLRGKMVFLRFDHSDCGLSDGDFYDLTIKKLSTELGLAIESLKKEQSQVEKISLVAHSLGACVALDYKNRNPEEIDKIIFLSPAFNQRELLRYWFLCSTVGKENIDWSNFREYLDEDRFQEFVRKEIKMMGEHWLGNEYHMENENKDYQGLLQGIDADQLLIIYGNEDSDVPFESNDNLPASIRKIRVEGGDHDLEKPEMVKQYISKVTSFLRD